MMSVGVLAMLLPRALWMGKLITKAELDRCEAEVENRMWDAIIEERLVDEDPYH